MDADDASFSEHGKDCSGECALTAAGTHYVDECGKCLLSTDEAWNSCIDDNSGSGSSSDKEDGKVSDLYMIIVGVSVVAVILICCAVMGIGWLCQKHKEMNRTGKQIQEVYAPMNDPGDSEVKVRSGLTVLPGDPDEDL